MGEGSKCHQGAFVDAKTFLIALRPAILATLGAALTILLMGALLLRGPRLSNWRAALMPLALGSGFAVGYVILFDLPKSVADLPWKMSLFIAALAGVFLAAARVTPKVVAAAIAAALIAGATWLLVRKSWGDDWPYCSAALITGLVLYLFCLLPVAYHEEMWLMGPVIMWICFTAASGPTLTGIDQTLGRMLILLACLAGLAAVAGIFPPLRLAAANSGPFLSIMYASILLLALIYNPGFPESPTIPLKAFILLACGPLPAAISWLPVSRKHPWWCLLAATIIAAAFVIPGAIIAGNSIPAFE